MQQTDVFSQIEGYIRGRYFQQNRMKFFRVVEKENPLNPLERAYVLLNWRESQISWQFWLRAELRIVLQPQAAAPDLPGRDWNVALQIIDCKSGSGIQLFGFGDPPAEYPNTVSSDQYREFESRLGGEVGAHVHALP